MLRLNLISGTAWTNFIIVNCDENGDLIKALDDYYEEFSVEGFPVPLYKAEELSDEDLDTYIPINGGEYYIEGISSVINLDNVNVM
jgi:hypothetical protein